MTDLSRASVSVHKERPTTVKELFKGFFLKKGQHRLDKWRSRFFVYLDSGIIQYFASGPDTSKIEPLGEINITKDAKEIRWSHDAIADSKHKSFPVRACLVSCDCELCEGHFCCLSALAEMMRLVLCRVVNGKRTFYFTVIH